MKKGEMLGKALVLAANAHAEQIAYIYVKIMLYSLSYRS